MLKTAISFTTIELPNEEIMEHLKNDVKVSE